MLLKRLTLWLVVGLLLVPGVSGLRAQEPVTLVMLSHFAEADRLRTLEAMVEDYTALHPEVSIEIQTVPFEELLTRIITARTAGTSPDIYHVYNLWLPEFTRSGLLAPLPEEMA
ncbi:MAG: extracellular solute-binding protein, partial [Anaerolineae bacterium]|nr:extracellular solute-binding protein [Anaerolineae bacterium]